MTPEKEASKSLVLAQLHIPYACRSLHTRPCGTQQLSTTNPSGQRTAPSLSSGALVMISDTLPMVITSLVGREMRSNKPWTRRACSMRAEMGSRFYRKVRLISINAVLRIQSLRRLKDVCYSGYVRKSSANRTFYRAYSTSRPLIWFRESPGPLFT